ncbi:MAG: NAD(P)H-dependent oxidoreductase subunit E [Calditrichota bacterium]
MATLMERVGLCSTCNLYLNCTYRLSSEQTIWQCEEFDNYVSAVVRKSDGHPGGLIGILEAIQTKFGYLPQEALKAVAQNTGRSMVDIYGIATFYRAFSLYPRGEHLVSVCLGTACHVRGAPRVAVEFKKQLAIEAGQTTPNGKFSLETVNCLGACALGPIAVVDGHYFSQVNITKVADILKQAEIGVEQREALTDQRIFPVAVSCSRCNHSLMDNNYLIDERPSIRVTQSFGQRHGWLRLSSLYGSYHVEAEYDVPTDSVIHIFCPHCHAELIGADNCPECGVRLVPFIVRGGGVIQICPKRGCRGHLLDIE